MKDNGIETIKSCLYSEMGGILFKGDRGEAPGYMGKNRPA